MVKSARSPHQLFANTHPFYALSHLLLLILQCLLPVLVPMLFVAVSCQTNKRHPFLPSMRRDTPLVLLLIDLDDRLIDLVFSSRYPYTVLVSCILL